MQATSCRLSSSTQSVDRSQVETWYNSTYIEPADPGRTEHIRLSHALSTAVRRIFRHPWENRSTHRKTEVPDWSMASIQLEASSGIASRISVVGASRSSTCGSRHETHRQSFLDELAQDARKEFLPSKQLIDGHGISANGHAWSRIRALLAASLSQGQG